jgi:hypothetical protein
VLSVLDSRAQSTTIQAACVSQKGIPGRSSTALQCTPSFTVGLLHRSLRGLLMLFAVCCLLFADC